MNYKKILFKLPKLESEYKILLKEFKNHNIIKSEPNHYLKEDKESFKLLWEKYIILLSKFRKLMKASKYRRWIIFPIFFIDSIEKTHKNFISTTDEFIKSRKRPKLSLFLK